MVKKKFCIITFIFALSLSTIFTNQVKAATNQYKRLWGNNRYETCSAISKEGWNGTSDYAVIVNGENFSDALSAVTLAKKYNAPVLLTQNNTLDVNSYNELIRLKVKSVFIVGGSSVVSTNVEKNIQDLGIKTVRYMGKDRNETSVEVANAVGTDNGIMLAVDNDFTDALCAAPIAAKLQIPIILISKDTIPESVTNLIAGKNITKTYVIGGLDLISDSVTKQFPNVQRIYGNDEYERNRNIIRTFSDKIDFSNICFAYSKKFPDALSGSAYAAINGNPIVLIGDESNIATKNFLKSRMTKNTGITIFGGQAGITDSQIDWVTDFDNDAGSDLATLIKNADSYFINSNFNNLLDTCTNIISIDPSNINAYIYRAYAYNEAGDYYKGISDCNEAIELDPNSCGSYAIRGWAYKIVSSLDNSTQDSKKAVSLNGADMLFYYFRANAYFDLEKYDNAIADLNKVTELNPNFAMAYNDLGNSYNRDNQFNEALKAFNKAISINPNLADAYNGRGNYYHRLKQYENAITEYTKAIDISVSDTAYLNRGISYYDFQQYDNALSDFSKAISINPNYENVYFDRGLTYYVLHDYEKAISDYSEAIKLKPDDPDPYLERSKCYGLLNQSDKQKEDYDKYLLLSKNNTN